MLRREQWRELQFSKELRVVRRGAQPRLDKFNKPHLGALDKKLFIHDGISEIKKTAFNFICVHLFNPGRIVILLSSNHHWQSKHKNRGWYCPSLLRACPDIYRIERFAWYPDQIR